MFASWKTAVEKETGTTYSDFVPVKYATRGSIFPMPYKIVFNVGNEK